MMSDPDKLLNQLVMAALTIFSVVVMLLAALVLRQLWLQHRIAELSSDAQVSLEGLEEINEEIQQELGELRTTPGSAQDPDDWQGIVAALDDVHEQLEMTGEDLDEVTLALDPPADDPTTQPDDEPAASTQDQIDQVFTIFAVLVGLASIAIAILLGLAVSVQQKVTAGEKHHS